jgi:hypothetical protein
MNLFFMLDRSHNSSKLDLQNEPFSQRIYTMIRILSFSVKHICLGADIEH